ncbi:autotransporter-associated beta strand repeat-containing protein [Prosthecobacter sp. SYSU 5D2]|uniref:autotransporter-associated beta strand repeat-containing protein n=1 Tax=Prosthecobacter sp. SYSU 5D2 TaxID=3134134 RepID=UPI0031FE5BCB
MAPPGPHSLLRISVVFHALLLLPAWAEPILWSGSTSTDFTLGSNWVGANPPANNLTADIATFSGPLVGSQPALGSAYSVNGVDMTGGYTLSGSGPLTLGSGGFMATGTNTLSLQSILLGTNATLNLASTTTVSGTTIDTNGFTLTLRTQETSGLDLGNAVISGSGNVIFRAGSGSRIITLGSANTFTGSVLVSTTNISFSSLANGGVASSFGQGTGEVTLGDASSVVALTYTGTGGVTDRLFKAGNGSADITITNNGSGAIEFNNTGAFGGATTAGPRKLTLSGTQATSPATATTGHSIFGQQLTDYANHPLSLTKSGSGTWLLSNLDNSFTGGITMTGGQLRISGDGALGAVNNNITFTTGNSILVATQTMTLNASRTITVDAGRTASFNIIVIGGANFLQIDSKITGAGNVSRAASASGSGVLRFSNDSNDYTGNFTASNGTVEFTSVANAGSPSALGAGTTIALNNGSSGAAFRYIGSTDTTTTRPLTWGATTGTMALTNNGTGTVGFLSTASMVTGNGAKNWTMTGTNAGNNILAQVINDSPNATKVSVTKSAAGRWVLTGVNTYTGDTLISGGNLQVGLAGAGSIAAGSAVSLTTTSSRLSGTGSVFGSTTLTFGAIVPGDEGGASAGKLTFGNLTFSNTAASNVIQLSLFDQNTFDQIDVTGTLSVNDRTNILVDGSGYVPEFEDSFELLSWINLANDGFTVGDTRNGGNGGSNLYLPDLSPFDPAWVWEISALSSGSLIVSVVPEPSRVMLLALGFCTWGLRRRR